MQAHSSGCRVVYGKKEAKNLDIRVLPLTKLGPRRNEFLDRSCTTRKQTIASP